MTTSHPQPNADVSGRNRVQALDTGLGLALLTAVLWALSLVMCYALLTTPVFSGRHGLMNITESFGALERVALWQRSLSWLPGGHADGTFVEWPKPVIVWSVRLAMAGMFVLQWLAFRISWRSSRFGLGPWLIGPVGAQIIMLLMVPSNSDVFFYAMSSDIANSGLNPYTTRMLDMPANPIYPYVHWVEINSVYGPLWTMISQATMYIAGNDPASAALAFKILCGFFAIALAVGVWIGARLLHVRRQYAVAAAVLVAWQPNMLIEAAGQAHNDPLVIGLALAAVVLTILGAGTATRGGLILGTLSIAIKYISLPILGALALTRLGDHHRGHGVHRIAAQWVVDTIAIGAVLIALFGPYWSDFSMLQEMVTQAGRLYTNPIWFDPYILIRQFNVGAANRYIDITGPILQGTAVLLVAIVIARFGWQAWRQDTSAVQPKPGFPIWTRPLLIAFAAIYSIIAFVPVNTHAWYWTWPVVPIAVLVAWDGEHHPDAPQEHRWFTPYLILTALMTLAYHTRIVMP